MLEKIKAHLTDDAKYWYKLWSTWMAIAWGGAVYAISEDPSSIQQLLNAVPAPYNHIIPPFAFIIAGPLPIVVRLLKQGAIAQHVPNDGE